MMGATTIAVTTGAQTIRGAPTDALDQTYIALAIEYLRSLVDPVPGSGEIRGVWMFKGVTYAFRDDELGLECRMFKETSTGWEQISTPSTLLPGGRYEFRNFNFFGNTGSLMMYGVDGVNDGFQFDGTTYTPIPVAGVTGKPEHLYMYKYFLFYSFQGGSIQHSAIGDPTIWSAIVGAGEIAIGEECTGFIGVPGEALGIFGRNSTYILSGDSVGNWVLNTLDDDSGALEWSIQPFKYPIYADDRGVTNLQAVQAFGDFKPKTRSQKIQRIIKSILPLITSSVRVREKNQYRLYLSDGRILIFGLDGTKMIGTTVGNYGVTMVVTESIEDLSGNEVLLGGGSDGFAYRLDSGTSFDGNSVEAWIRPIFNHFNSPENKKRFFKAVLEIDADENVDLVFLPEFGYGNPDLPSAIENTISVIGGGGIWDTSDTEWRDFYWDAQLIDTAEGYIDGIGRNLSLFIRSTSTYAKPHTIQGIIIHYSTRGISR